MTSYTVLKKKGEEWYVAGNTQASSAKAAVASIANGTATSDKLEGTFIAIPSRSWQPITVKVERALKFSS